jgi:hypothetical protein
MINIWVYDDKSLFLAKAETALILAGLIYVAMNMTLMVFPTILYGLPMEGLVNVVNLQPQPFFQDLKANDGFEVIAIENQETLPSQDELKLFTPDYLSVIEQVVLSNIDRKCFVNPEFKLTSFSLETGIPSHHLTYFFNNIKGISIFYFINVQYKNTQLKNNFHKTQYLNSNSQSSNFIKGLKESDAYPAMPEDGYGWEKLFSERMCRHFYEDYGLETRVARYHNVYGPMGTFDGGREKAPAALCRKII